MNAAAEPSRPAVARWAGRLHGRLTGLSPRAEAGVIALGCLGVAAALAGALALPGKTFSFIYVNDMMIFLDGASRVLDGQVPNRDFHTPLGPVAYLFPAIGLWLSGSFGGMMPLATAAFALLFLPLLIHVCVSRLPLGYAAVFAVFATALVVGPASIGETLPSYAMFYNRWGYALLALLFLLILPQQRGRPLPWADALVAGIVLLLTFYLKISYFAVALGFTLILLLFRDSRRLALSGLAAAAVGGLLVHLVWGGTGGYVADIRMTASVTGAVRASLLGLVRMAIENAAMIVPFLLVFGLAAIRGAPLRILFLCLVMAGGGLLLYNQNFQGPGIMTLVPAAIVAGLALSRRPGGVPSGKEQFALTALLLVAAQALPPAVLAGESILLHSLLALKGGEAQEYVAEVDGFITQEVYRPAAGQPGFEAGRLAYRAGAADIETLKLMRVQALRQVLAQPEYFWTIQDGLRLIRTHPRLGGSVITMDMANPFNALAGRSAPRGADSWYHAGRNFNERVYRTPAELFADVDVVMVPKAPVQPPSHLLLMKLYRPYLSRNYGPVAASDYWVAFARKSPVPAR